MTFYFFISALSDQREPMEMNAAACPNPNCTEPLDMQTDDEVTKCQRCDEAVTDKHRQTYRDMMLVTRMHLDKMKQSSVACMPVLLYIILINHNFDQLITL